MTSMHTVEQTVPATFQVGVFALIRHRGAYLIVRPHQPLLPGGDQGLPGLLLGLSSGQNLVEMNLRRVIREQVKLVVSDLKLIGSHASRGPQDSGADARLNMIFGTEYSAGILAPNADLITAADWIPQRELLETGAYPEWLAAAVREFETTQGAAAPDEPAQPRLRFGRRR
ncbi:hypothetical protein M8445_03210 [Deinococcus aquaticus]|uniref:Nudix hydrolase domain-containing protein n=2 Tax=Deinococcaceae TaxID=183710 RepID=A0ABY7V244_9DEIO|nr:hypothetical protein [Deinococcus aquaticus]WDA59238.1 hypothetical protein M8445_03210 [Deinococcus aquaticus]